MRTRAEIEKELKSLYRHESKGVVDYAWRNDVVSEILLDIREIVEEELRLFKSTIEPQGRGMLLASTYRATPVWCSKCETQLTAYNPQVNTLVYCPKCKESVRWTPPPIKKASDLDLRSALIEMNCPDCNYRMFLFKPEKDDVIHCFKCGKESMYVGDMNV